jgi:L-2-hydroxyglutarate oxidase
MNTDFIVIGGGIVGLSTAYQILQQKPNAKVTVLEKEDSPAKHQTGNNSGVIHSGIYYKPGSLKAQNCLRGYKMLIDFCECESIPYELCGKIIVATEKKELPQLENIYKRGLENGLQNIRKISAEEIKEYEPHCAGIAGIHVPQTGIVYYKKVAEKLVEKIRQAGGEVLFGQKVQDIYTGSVLQTVITQSGSFSCRVVINCAGLYSDKIAAKTVKDLNLRIIPFRGEYYQIKKEREYLVKNLIYPVPDPNFPFLGVHFTRMMKGGVEAGPNAVLAFRREGYKKSDVHFAELWEVLTWSGFQKVAFKYWETGLYEMYRSFSKAAFTRALQRLVPEIQSDDLTDGGAGVRAQAADREGGLIDDFLIFEQKGVVNVCNAPSPAATSSLSIGLTVSEIALKQAE